jgi:hypothetical protein
MVDDAVDNDDDVMDAEENSSSYAVRLAEGSMSDCSGYGDTVDQEEVSSNMELIDTSEVLAYNDSDYDNDNDNDNN